MSRLVVIHSILAPVDVSVLSRAESLRILGDQTCEVDDDGMSSRPVDEAGNLMGAIAVLWHDSPDAQSAEIDLFLSKFFPNPTEIRREVVMDPHWSAQGDCGSYFQNESGSHHIYEGYLLVSPDCETIEEFFAEGCEMLT